MVIWPKIGMRIVLCGFIRRRFLACILIQMFFGLVVSVSSAYSATENLPEYCKSEMPASTDASQCVSPTVGFHTQENKPLLDLINAWGTGINNKDCGKFQSYLMRYSLLKELFVREKMINAFPEHRKYAKKIYELCKTPDLIINEYTKNLGKSSDGLSEEDKKLSRNEMLHRAVVNAIRMEKLWPERKLKLAQMKTKKSQVTAARKNFKKVSINTEAYNAAQAKFDKLNGEYLSLEKEVKTLDQTVFSDPMMLDNSAIWEVFSDDLKLSSFVTTVKTEISALKNSTGETVGAEFMKQMNLLLDDPTLDAKKQSEILVRIETILNGTPKAKNAIDKEFSKAYGKKINEIDNGIYKLCSTKGKTLHAYSDLVNEAGALIPKEQKQMFLASHCQCLIEQPLEIHTPIGYTGLALGSLTMGGALLVGWFFPPVGLALGNIGTSMLSSGALLTGLAGGTGIVAYEAMNSIKKWDLSYVGAGINHAELINRAQVREDLKNYRKSISWTMVDSALTFSGVGAAGQATRTLVNATTTLNKVRKLKLLTPLDQAHNNRIANTWFAESQLQLKNLKAEGYEGEQLAARMRAWAESTGADRLHQVWYFDTVKGRMAEGMARRAVSIGSSEARIVLTSAKDNQEVKEIFGLEEKMVAFLNARGKEGAYNGGLKEIEEGLQALSRATNTSFSINTAGANIESEIRNSLYGSDFRLAIDLRMSSKALDLLNSGHFIGGVAEAERVKKILVEARAVQGEWDIVKKAKESKAVYSWDGLIDSISSAKGLAESKTKPALEIAEMSGLLKKALTEKENSQALLELQSSLNRFHIVHPFTNPPQYGGNIVDLLEAGLDPKKMPEVVRRLNKKLIAALADASLAGKTPEQMAAIYHNIYIQSKIPELENAIPSLSATLTAAKIEHDLVQENIGSLIKGGVSKQAALEVSLSARKTLKQIFHSDKITNQMWDSIKMQIDQSRNGLAKLSGSTLRKRSKEIVVNAIQRSRYDIWYIDKVKAKLRALDIDITRKSSAILKQGKNHSDPEVREIAEKLRVLNYRLRLHSVKDQRDPRLFAVREDLLLLYLRERRELLKSTPISKAAQDFLQDYKKIDELKDAVHTKYIMFDTAMTMSKVDPVMYARELALKYNLREDRNGINLLAERLIAKNEAVMQKDKEIAEKIYDSIFERIKGGGNPYAADFYEKLKKIEGIAGESKDEFFLNRNNFDLLVKIASRGVYDEITFLTRLVALSAVSGEAVVGKADEVSGREVAKRINVENQEGMVGSIGQTVKNRVEINGPRLAETKKVQRLLELSGQINPKNSELLHRLINIGIENEVPSEIIFKVIANRRNMLTITDGNQLLAKDIENVFASFRNPELQAIVGEKAKDAYLQVLYKSVTGTEPRGAQAEKAMELLTAGTDMQGLERLNPKLAYEFKEIERQTKDLLGHVPSSPEEFKFAAALQKYQQGSQLLKTAPTWAKMIVPKYFKELLIDIPDAVHAYAGKSALNGREKFWTNPFFTGASSFGRVFVRKPAGMPGEPDWVNSLLFLQGPTLFLKTPLGKKVMSEVLGREFLFHYHATLPTMALETGVSVQAVCSVLKASQAVPPEYIHLCGAPVDLLVKGFYKGAYLATGWQGDPEILHENAMDREKKEFDREEKNRQLGIRDSKEWNKKIGFGDPMEMYRNYSVFKHDFAYMNIYSRIPKNWMNIAQKGGFGSSDNINQLKDFLQATEKGYDENTEKRIQSEKEQIKYWSQSLKGKELEAKVQEIYKEEELHYKILERKEFRENIRQRNLTMANKIIVANLMSLVEKSKADYEETKKEKSPEFDLAFMGKWLNKGNLKASNYLSDMPEFAGIPTIDSKMKLLKSPLFEALMKPSFSMESNGKKLNTTDIILLGEHSSDMAEFEKVWSQVYSPNKFLAAEAKTQMEIDRNAVKKSYLSFQKVYIDRARSLNEMFDALNKNENASNQDLSQSMKSVLGTFPLYLPAYEVASSMGNTPKLVEERKTRLARIKLGAGASECFKPEGLAFQKDTLTAIGLKVPFFFTDILGKNWEVKDDIDLIDLVSNQVSFGNILQEWKSCQITDADLLKQAVNQAFVQNVLMNQGDLNASNKKMELLPNRGIATQNNQSLNAHSKDSFEAISSRSHPLSTKFAFPKELHCTLGKGKKLAFDQAYETTFQQYGIAAWEKLRPALGGDKQKEETCRYWLFRDTWKTMIGTVFLGDEKELVKADRFFKQQVELRRKNIFEKQNCGLETDKIDYPDVPASFRCE